MSEEADAYALLWTTKPKEAEAIFAEALRLTGGNLRAAAANLRVSRQTFYRWLKKCPGLKQVFEEERKRSAEAREEQSR